MTAHIHSGEDTYHPIPDLPGLTPPERVVAKFWKLFPFKGMPTGTSEKISPAFINHGRWLVRCPWCPGAQVASKTDHRFFCDECGNNGEGWVTVIWPGESEDIEAIVGRRPNKQNRNWLPDETVELLRAENLSHGLPAVSA